MGNGVILLRSQVDFIKGINERIIKFESKGES